MTAMLTAEVISADTARSEDGDTLRERWQEIWEENVRSSRLSEAIAALDSAALEALLPNWDGYKARPINPGSYTRAVSFLAALPIFVSTPEISVNPRGLVTLHWLWGMMASLSVAVFPESEVSYALLTEREKVHDTECFTNEIPPKLLAHLRRIGQVEV